MTTSAGQQTLKQSQQELSAMQELHQKLHDEQNALVDDDAGSLIQLLDQKNEVLRLLTELEKPVSTDQCRWLPQRCIGHAGIPRSECRFRRTCAVAGLAQRHRTGKRKNRVNGSLIARKLAQNQAALNVFQQGSDTGLYMALPDKPASAFR
jgi:flagellar biosynthesis/type III secretory pathway chaperone